MNTTHQHRDREGANHRTAVHAAFAISRWDGKALTSSPRGEPGRQVKNQQRKNQLPRWRYEDEGKEEKKGGTRPSQGRR